MLQQFSTGFECADEGCAKAEYEGAFLQKSRWHRKLSYIHWCFSSWENACLRK